MSTYGILLVLASALCHASWNLFSKAGADPVPFLRRALQFSALIWLPLFVWLQFRVTYTATYTVCVLASGFCTGLYFYSLAKAYEHGHVSIAYPIARTFPILVVTWAGMFMHEFPSLTGMVGIVVIVAGCFVLPLHRFTVGPEGIWPANYLNKSSLWALAAALVTSIFSIIDKYAAATVAAHTAGDPFALQVNYVYIQNAVAGITMSILTWRMPSSHGTVHRGRAAAAGAIFLVSYTLIIMALARDPVAYVVSFRQLSIVITALVSMYLIEKKVSVPRMVGVGMIFAGVVLVGIG